MNRRESCRQMVIAGGAVLVTPVINACTRIEAVLTTFGAASNIRSACADFDYRF